MASWSHWQLNCLFSGLLRLMTKKIWWLRITGPVWAESSVTAGLTPQGASNAKSVSMPWHHHDLNSLDMCKLLAPALCVLVCPMMPWEEKETNMSKFSLFYIFTMWHCSVTGYLREKTNPPITKKRTVWRTPDLSLTQYLFNGCNAICVLCKMVNVNYHIRQSQRIQHRGYWCPGAYLVPRHLQQQ